MCSGNKVIKNIFSLFMCVVPSGLVLYGEMEEGASRVHMEEKEQGRRSQVQHCTCC